MIFGMLLVAGAYCLNLQVTVQSQSLRHGAQDGIVGKAPASAE